jgi:D-alanine-D-alanine ligase
VKRQKKGSEGLSRKNVALLFGGRSSEHEVSLISASGILSNINRNKYNLHLIKISKEGKWMLVSSDSDDPAQNLSEAVGDSVLTGDPSLKGFYVAEGEKKGQVLPVDVLFPVLHGTFGEDGTVQGLASLSNIPCVGSSVLGSALGMDKVMMKQIFIQSDLETTDFIWFIRAAWHKDPDTIIRGVKEAIGYPCFVKPANSGSSVGISKVRSQNELPDAVQLACGYDRKVLVEKAVNGREMECAVLGNDFPDVSIVGEIIPCNEFYDYQAKYLDNASQIVIPAELPDELTERIRYWSGAAFKALDCAGFARVDFLVDRDNHHLYINEINTIPGFTPISMFTQLWEASGISYADLIDRLIQLAIERHQEMIKNQFYR